MKKLFLKKLQSLTAILVLNAVPVSFAQSSISYEAVGSLTRVLTDERKNTLLVLVRKNAHLSSCI